MLIAAAVVVSGDVVLRPGWLRVEGTRVAEVGGGAPEHVDARFDESIIVPGFVDIHVHGGGGGGFTGDADGARRAVALHRAHGTTTTLASLVSAPAPDLLRSVAMLAGLAEEALIAGIHLEGPWLSDRRCGAHDAGALRDPDLGELAVLLAAGRDQIRMVTLAPERPGALDVIRALTRDGVVAAIGHTDATYAGTLAGIAAGARVATHLLNAMRPIHQREPGPVVALLEEPHVTVELVLDGFHLHPAIYRRVTSSIAADRVVLVTDAMDAAGMPDGGYRLGPRQIEVTGGVARIEGTGTLAGSTTTMDAVFRRAVALGRRDGDQSLLTAVRQTSHNPARVFGWAGHDLGVGGHADLVVLDAALAVGRVMRRGTWL